MLMWGNKIVAESVLKPVAYAENFRREGQSI